MLSGSGNTERLVARLSDVRVCRKSKMAVINRKRTGNNVFQLAYKIAKKFQRLYPCFQGQAT